MYVIIRPIDVYDTSADTSLRIALPQPGRSCAEEELL